MRVRRILVTTALAATVLVVGDAPPAAAAVSASTSGGNLMQVLMTGTGSADFSCVGGNAAANGVVALPSVACGALTGVSVIGDNAAQSVDGAGLNAAAFTQEPGLTAQMLNGNDYVRESAHADNLMLGNGTDQVALVAGGVSNSSIDLGADYDEVTASLPASGGSLILSAASPTLATLTATVTGPPVASGVTSAERFDLFGSPSADTISAAGVLPASGITTTILYGEAGNDTLAGGAKSYTLFGGTGTNTLTGGPTGGSLWSASATDTLEAGGTGHEQFVYDADGLRSGGRTYSGFGPEDWLHTQATDGDTVVRLRPGPAAGATLQTLSLHRTGQQLVPPGFGKVVPSLSNEGQAPHQTLTDVVVPIGREARPVGQAAGPGRDLLDVTVPTGTWTTTTGPGGLVSVTTNEAALGDVFAANVEDHRVHGPWVNRNQGFAHRATRDLLFRFPTDAARDQLRDQLTGGTRTRAQVTSSLMDTDEYRGLDVDRVFVAFLRRPSDPSGRTYWISSLRNGKALRQFRAQLFGSAEYFTKAGGTNEQYMVRAYADVLGRQPDASGQAYWTGKLNGGANRGAVAKAFLASTEARRNLTDEQFLRFLDRPATTGEQTTWISRLGSNAQGEQQLIAFLVGSAAYYDRT